MPGLVPSSSVVRSQGGKRGPQRVCVTHLIKVIEEWDYNFEGLLLGLIHDRHIFGWSACPHRLDTH